MQIKERSVAGKRGYQIDNFYSHPEWIFNKLLTLPPQTHGTGVSTSNGVYYTDMRHRECPSEELGYYQNIIEDLVGGIKAWTPHPPQPILQTNFMQWTDDPFNDWYNNYWWPHYDNGWSCIIYLNDSPSNGTNIYVDKNNHFEEVQKKTLEHLDPWQSKEHYELVDYLEPAFNRAFVFPAHELMHGAAVDDDTYFLHNKKFRLNQVMFFEEVKKDG